MPTTLAKAYRFWGKAIKYRPSSQHAYGDSPAETKDDVNVHLQNHLQHNQIRF